MPFADALCLLDFLDIERAVLVGLSMGAYTALRIALERPERVIACVSASGGAGSPPDRRGAFIRDAEGTAERMLRTGEFPVNAIALGPTRIQLRRKDPQGWEEFRQHLADHSVNGSTYTLRRVQAARPSLYDFEALLKAATTPILLMAGDEDEPCLDVNLFLKRTTPSAGQAADKGAWPPREEPDGAFGGIGLSATDDAAD